MNMKMIVFLSLMLVGPLFGDEEKEMAEEEASSLYDYYLNESADDLGIARSKEWSQKTDKDRIIGTRFSLFDEDDSALQLDILDSKTRFRIRTRGKGAGNDQKEIMEQIRLGASLHLRDDLLTIFIGGATGKKINERYTQISGGHKEQEFDFNIRNLYAELQPIEGARFTVGSFSPYYGLGSQATLKTGYRMQLDLKKLLENSFGKWMERVTAEATFCGDNTEPNVFHRLDRLWGSNNSNSVLVESAELLDGFKIAVGFEHFQHREYLPLQAAWKIDKIFIKDIVAQSLTELGDEKSYAVGVHARFNPITRLTIQAGFTIISDDFDYPNDTGKYPPGKRFDVTITYILPYGFALEGFYGDDFRRLDDLENARADFTVSWDALRFYDEWRKANEEKKKP